MLHATVVKTTDGARDRTLGMSMIVDQFMRRSRTYSKARVETDEAFDQRLLHVAKRREVHRLDKVIVTALIDALLADGYALTDASYDEFELSTDREAILELLLDVDLIELVAERNGEESWMRLIFGENGWDLVQDHTVDLGYLINPIVEPLLPWKRKPPNAATPRSVSLRGAMLKLKDAEMTDERDRTPEERFLDEMVEGYLDGRKADNPEPSANRSASYRHGFANGRDELAHSPRLPAQVLRLLADQAIRDDVARTSPPSKNR